MSPDTIKTLVSFIDGAYPAARLFVQNMNEHWPKDEFLLEVEMDGQQKNRLKVLISEHGHPPTLAEVRDMVRQIVWRRATKTCSFCDGSGWTKGASEFDIVDGEHVGPVELSDLMLNYKNQGNVKPMYYRVARRCTNC
jgi:hypothetical protein